MKTLLLLCAALALATFASAQTVAPRRADRKPTPAPRHLTRNRTMAKPMARAAEPVPAADALYAWALPGKGDTLRVKLLITGPRGDSTSLTQRLEITSRHDPLGLVRVVHTDRLETATPDSAWIGGDLNGDGEPDLAVKRSRRERPLTGQWIDIAGLREGRVREWLTRLENRVPKSLVRIAGAPRPLVMALEPLDEAWPQELGDPPARTMLLALEDSSVVDVSARHADWFAPGLAASAALVDQLESRNRRDQDWAQQVVEHTWGLLAQGGKSQARAYFEAHAGKAAAVRQSLREYLESQRGLLQGEWF